MRIVFIISLLSLFVFTAYKNIDNPLAETHAIKWCEGHQLEWKDFKGRVPVTSSNAAQTAYEVGFDVNMVGNRFEFVVTCNFLPHKSWVRKKDANDHILRHEQLHFDIAEIYARKMRKELNEADITVRNLQSKADKIYEKNWNALTKMQRDYDRETNHSIKKQEQADWDKKIMRMLKENQKYAFRCK